MEDSTHSIAQLCMNQCAAIICATVQRLPMQQSLLQWFSQLTPSGSVLNTQTP